MFEEMGLLSADKDEASAKSCGGPNCCEGREFDDSNSECQKCLQEAYGT
jgi:hypothetical protein